MATYILKRRLYSLNPSKLTYSDVAIELGINFPDDLKKLSRMERSMSSELHYWAVNTPGIYMTAPAEVIYQSLTTPDQESGQASTITPVLMDPSGDCIMYFNTASGKYNYDGVDLDDENAMVNALMAQLDKVYGSISSSAENPELNGGQVEAIKQQSINYQVYRDMVAKTFMLPTLEEIQSQNPQG